MSPDDLRRELERQGVALLGVAAQRRDPQVLVVYLNGNAGHAAHAFARSLIASLDGVASVSESIHTPTIVYVRLASGGGGGTRTTRR